MVWSFTRYCDDRNFSIRIDQVHLIDLNVFILIIKLVDTILVDPQILEIKVQRDLEAIANDLRTVLEVWPMICFCRRNETCRGWCSPYV